MDEGEESLRAKLAQHTDKDDAYASLLDQLASTRLIHGHMQEAQGYYKELASLRASHLRKEAQHAAAEVADAPPHQQGEQPKEEQGHPNQRPSQQHEQHQLQQQLGEDERQPQQLPHQQQPQQQQQQQQPAVESQAESEEDEWETKNWDHALERIRPPVPSGPSRKPSQPPPVKKAPTLIAADAIEECSRKQQGGSEGLAPFLEALDETEVVTNWSGGFDHCVELGGLTTDVRTGDLQELMDSLLPDDIIKPYIRWSDDNHAVLVCANVTSANNLLGIAAKEGMDLRPFLDATQASKQLPISELLPPKNRPKTSTTVARRLMSHALGLPGIRDKAGERDLAAARKQAREDRKARQQAAEESMAAAWDD